MTGPVGIDRVGIVVIGRNEGTRLHACLASAVAAGCGIVVYVDSGSTDDSIAHARSRGVETVFLDDTRPFTAARARNAGVARMLALAPDIAFVQFVDGDCELDPGWIPLALATMARQPRTAALCGRRRERYPHATIYNRLCDIEWDAPTGTTDSCGGDSLMRIEPFLACSGFTPELIAGEEPDLCHRLRRAGWSIVRLADEMTLHDVAMTRLRQWWLRNQRSGHAGAEAWHRRGHEDRWLLKHVLSNTLWALPLFWPLWPLLWLRVWRRSGALYATHIVVGKLPHFAGHLGFWWSRLRRRRMDLIEYR